MQFLLALLYFSRCVMRMESFLLFRIAQMPVAGVPDRNRCRWHRDNASFKETKHMFAIIYSINKKWQNTKSPKNVSLDQKKVRIL